MYIISNYLIIFIYLTLTTFSENRHCRVMKQADMPSCPGGGGKGINSAFAGLTPP